MQKTQNYNLNKPELTDPVRVDDFNENAEIIDGLLVSLTTAVGAMPKITAGSYTITSTDQPFTVSVGFRPKAVLIWKNDVSYNSTSFYSYTALLLDGFPIQVSDTMVIGTVCDGGFTLKQQIASVNGQSYYPRIAECCTYVYVAFG